MKLPLRPIAVCSLISSIALAQPTTRPAYVVTADRAEAMYRAGETAKFHVSNLAKSAGPAKLNYRLTRDGFGTPLSTGEIEQLPAEVSASRDTPGFVRFELIDGSVGVAGAGFDAESIKPSTPVPDDFDSFWAEQKRLVAADTAKPVVIAVSSPSQTVETFDVQVNCPGGAPLSAYYAKPKGAKPKSLPAILFPHSAGVRSSQLTQAVHGAKLGCISVDFNAHGIPNGKPAEFYTDLLNGELKGYTARGRDSRDTIYFRGMFLRVIRALEFITSQPEWDGKTLIVYGSSQGGGQAIVAAGLDPRVTFCAASVPALCDHTGFAADRVSGWPKLVPKDAAGAYDAKIAQVARYFDAMNFATRSHADSIVSVGLIDAVCQPTSVYAAYNALPRTKRIVPRPQMGHEFPEDLRNEFDDAVRAHIAARSK